MDLRIRKYWTVEEDEILRREALLQCNTAGAIKNWNKIASKLPGRTNKDCRKRWSKVGVNVNRGHWKLDEDDRLRAAVEEHGCCWTVVAQKVTTRHADQCAKRWHHFLDPKLSHKGWDRDEDDLLLEAVRKYGRSWKLLSDEIFHGRSTTEIKNRYVIAQRNYENRLEPGIRNNKSRDPELGTPPDPHMLSLDEESDYAQPGSSPVHIAGNHAATASSLSRRNKRNTILAPSRLPDLSQLSNDYTTDQLPIMHCSTPDLSVDMDPGHFSNHTKVGTVTEDSVNHRSDYYPQAMDMYGADSFTSAATGSFAPIAPPVFEVEHLMDDLNMPEFSTMMSAPSDATDMTDSSMCNYTVLLEDVRPEMVGKLMNYVMSSKAKVKMRIVSSDTT